MSKYLTLDDITGVQDRNTIEVEVPEWGGTVLLAELTVTDRDWYEGRTLDIAQSMTGASIKGLRVELVRRCLVDEDLQPLFGKKSMAKLEAKSGLVVDRLFDLCQELNDINPDEEVEEVKENLGESQNSSSGTS